MTAQIIAVAIFVVMFALIVSEKIERQWVSLGCGLLMLIVVFGICMQDMEAVCCKIYIQILLQSRESELVSEKKGDQTVLKLKNYLYITSRWVQNGYRRVETT